MSRGLQLLSALLPLEDDTFPPLDPFAPELGMPEPAGAPGAGIFAGLFMMVVLVGVGMTIWRVSTARRMAREAGMNESDATTMSLITDNGLEATYLLSTLRQGQTAAPATVVADAGAPGTDPADRLRALRSLLEQGLVTQAEYDARRQAILDEV